MKKNILSVIGIIVLIGVVGLVYFNAKITTKPSDNEETKLFTIESGQGVKEISANLEEAGLSESDFIFQTYVWLKKSGSKIQAGDYYIPQDLSMVGLLKLLTSGEALTNERVVKIIEGWTAVEIAEYMAKFAAEDGNYTEESYKEMFLKSVRMSVTSDVGDVVYGFLSDKPADQGLEGYLFPDTYRIFKNSDPSHLIGKMMDNLDNKLTQEMRNEIERQGKTIYDIITLASIVEHEVLTLEDKKIVAGIFYSRMENGIPLESDATVNYITGKNALQPTFADTEIDNPYNTYENQGLPPGPISNPGIDSIVASIYPEDSDYFFFLTKPDGTTVFSKTFEEHLTNKAKYLD